MGPGLSEHLLSAAVCVVLVGRQEISFVPSLVNEMHRPEASSRNYLREISGCHKWPSGDQRSPRRSPVACDPLYRKGIVLGSLVRTALPSRPSPRCQRALEKRLRFHAGEDGLRHEKIIALLPLVRRVAVGMRARMPSFVETDELVGAGALGLVDAIRKFDARRQVKLESYARHRIRGAILDSLRSLDTASRDVRNKGKRAEKVHRELELRMGCAPDDEGMARGLGISLEKWHRTAREIHLAGASGDLYVRLPRNRMLSVDTIAAEIPLDQFELCYRSEQRELVSRALDRLPERERMIFHMYHRRELTMKQIGRLLNIDESRVSQLHSAGLAGLRGLVTEFLRPPIQRPPSRRRSGPLTAAEPISSQRLAA